MKRATRVRVVRGLSVCLTLLATLLAGPFSAMAAPVVWTGGIDATWDNTGNWSTSATPGTGDDVTFPFVVPGTGKTVTLGGTLLAPETANSLSFLNSYTLSGGFLSLTSGTVFTDFATNDTITSQLTGTGGLTKTGYGTLQLTNASNSYTGTTTINAGSIEITDPGALGTSTTAVVINGNTTRGMNTNQGGGQLVLNGGVAGVTFGRGITLNGGGPTGDGNALVLVGNNTISGPINDVTTSRIATGFGTNTVTGTLNVAASQTLQVQGDGILLLNGGTTVNTSAILEKTGSSSLSTLILGTGGTNTITGELRASNGFFRISGPTGGTLGANGGQFEIRTDNGAGFTNTKFAGRASSTTFFDHAIGSSAINGTVVFADSSVATSNTTQTFSGRDGYGATLTGVGGVGTGAISIATGNPTTFTNSMNGLLTFNGVLTNADTTARTFTFNGNGDTQILQNLALTGQTHVVSKSGQGQLTITATGSTYTGGTSVSGGTLAVTQMGALNGANGALSLNGGSFSYLGTAAGGETTAKVFNLSGTTGNGYILANETAGSTPLVLSNGVAAGGAGIKNLILGGSSTLANEIQGLIQNNSATNTTSLLKLGAGTWIYGPNAATVSQTTAATTAASSGETITVASTAGLVVGQSVSGTNVPAGAVIANILSATQFTISSIPGTAVANATTLTFGATSNFTGSVTIDNGTLKLRATSGAFDIINNTSAVTFGADGSTAPALGTQSAGGTLEYIGFSTGSSETMGALTASAGASTVKVTPGASGTTGLTFASLANHAAGATLNFAPSTGTITFTAAPTLVNGIIPGAVINGSDWVTATAATPISAYAGYTAPAAGVITSAATTNVRIDNTSTGNLTLSAVGTNDIYTLATNDPAARVVDVGSGNTLRLGAVGGILVPLASGGLTIGTGATPGTLTAGGAANTAGELLVYANGGLTVNSVIANNGTGAVSVTKSGAGTMVLSGANTYTGNTVINEGTVQLSGAAATLGTISTAANVTTIRQAGTLDLNGAGAAGVVTIGMLNGAGTVTNSGGGTATASTLVVGGTVGTTNNQVFSGVLQDGAGRLNVTKGGNGAIVEYFIGANTYTGATTLNSGTLAVTSLANIGQASGIGKGDVANNAASLVFNGGTLQYTGSNSLYQQTTQTPSVSIDRLFTLAGSGTIDSSGTFGNNVLATGAANNATLIFNNSNPLAFSTSGAKTLTLTGSSTGDNAINIKLINNTVDSSALAVTKASTGLWLLTNATNSYTGLTSITGGALQAIDGTTLPTASPLVLNGGVFQSSGSFTRSLTATPTAGSGGLNFSGTAAGGFSSSGGKLTVNIGGAGQQVTWATGGFAGGTLILNNATGLGEVELVNPIALGTTSRTVQVDDNTTTTTDFATLSGVISGGATGINSLVKTGSGFLNLFGANTYIGNTNLQNGVTYVQSFGSTNAVSSNFGAGPSGTNSGQLLLGSSTNTVFLNYVGNGETTDRPIVFSGTTGNIVIDSSGSGPLVLSSLNRTGTGAGTGVFLLFLRGSNNDNNIITSAITNDGSANATNIQKDNPGTWILSGNNTYSGTTTISSGAMGVGSNTAFGTSGVTVTNAQLFAFGGDRALANNLTISNATPIFVGQNSLAFTGNVSNTGGNSNVQNNLPAGKTLTLGTAGTSVINLQETTNSRTLNFTGTGTTIALGAMQNGGTATGGVTMNMPSGLLQLGATSATSSYTGTFTLAQGTVQLLNSEQIPDAATVASAPTGPFTFSPAASTTGTFDLNGKNETVNAFTMSPAGTAILDNTGSTNSNFTFGAGGGAVTIAPTGTGIIRNSGTGTLSLTKTGTNSATIGGTTQLLYTGSTNVNGGTLTINNTLNGTTGLNASAGGVMNVNGAVNIPTTLGLSANGTGSTINLGGTLNTPNRVTSVTLSGGGILNFNNGVAVPLTGLTSMLLGTGTLGIELGANTLNSDTFATTAATGGGNVVTFNIFALPGFGASTTYDLISSATGGLLSGGTSYQVGIKPSGYTYSFNNTDNLIQLVLTAAAGTNPLYWRGGVNNSWAGVSGANTNFTSDLAGNTNAQALPGPGSDVIFSAINATGPAISTTLDGSFSVNSLQFTANPTGVTGVTIAAGTGGILTIAPSNGVTSPTNGVSVADNAGAVTISAPVVLGSNQTWTTTGAGTNGSSLTVSGAISGSGGLTKAGAGSVVLSGDASNYTGALTLNAGTLALRSNGTGASGQLITYGSGTGAAFNVTGNGTLDVQSASLALNVNQGNTMGLGTLNIGSQNLTVTGLTGGAGATTGPSSYAVSFNGANITGNPTFTLGTTNTLSAPITLAGVVTAQAGNTITVAGPAAPAQAAVLRITNTSSTSANQLAASNSFVVNTGGTLEAHVAVGGFDNGTSSLGQATVTLGGGTLRVSPQYNNAMTGTAGFFGRYYSGEAGTGNFASNDLSSFNWLGSTLSTAQTGVINSPNGTSYTAGAGMTVPTGLPTTTFSAMYTGVLNVTTGGVYGFNTSSDDGTQVFVDGTLVVNNNGNHGVSGVNPWGSIFLTPGAHVITERYEQGTGSSANIVSYQGADTGGSLVLLGSIPGTVVTPGTAPSVTFGNGVSLTAATASTIDMAVDTTVSSLNAGAGSTLNVTSSGLNTLTLSSVTAAGAFTVQPALNANLNLGNTTIGGLLTVNPGASALVTASGVISDGGGGFGVTKTGAGTAVFTNANTYGGITTLTTGILQTNNPQGFGTSAAANAVTLGGGQLNLRFDGSTTFGPTAGTGYGVTVTANSTVNVDRDTAVGPTGGVLTLGATTIGANTLTTSNGNAYTLAIGPVTSTDASVFTNNGLLSIAALNETNAALKTVTFNGTGTTTLSGNVAATTLANLAVLKNGTGTLAFTNANPTFTGTTSVDQGVLSFTTDTTLAGPLQVGSTSGITTTATLNIAGNVTVPSLTVQTNSSSADVLTIAAGKTLTVNGNVSIGSSSAASTVTALNSSGGGTLTVNNPTSGGSFVVGGVTSAASVGNKALVDLSGLAALNVTLNTTTGTFRVNPANANNTSDKYAVLTLPTTTTVTASTLAVGDSAQNNGTAGQVNVLKLGSGASTFNVGTINIGSSASGRDVGQIVFANAGSGSVTIAGATGGTSRAAFNLGAGSGVATGVANQAADINVFDTTGHNATLQLGAAAIATQNKGATYGTNFSFDTGSLVMTSLTMGQRTTETANGGGQARVTNTNFNVGGGTASIDTGVLALGQVTGGTFTTVSTTINAAMNFTGGNSSIGATSGTSVFMADNKAAAASTVPVAVNASFNVGGSAIVTLAGDIAKGVVSNPSASRTASATVTLTGSGTLDMGGHAIGTTNAIDTLTLASGTLANVGSVNATGGVQKTTAGTLTLAGSNTYTAATDVKAGTFLVNGTHTGTSVAAYAIRNAAALGGIGSTVANVNLDGGATITGAGLGTVGTFTTGDETWATNSTFLVDATSLANPDYVDLGGGPTKGEGTGGGGTDYDKLVLGNWTGPATGTATLKLSGSNVSLPSFQGGAYYIVAHSSVTGAFGPTDFAPVSNLTVDTSALTVAGGLPTPPTTFTAVAMNNGQDLAIYANPVPEPAALSLLLAAAGALGLRRRRSRERKAV